MIALFISFLRKVNETLQLASSIFLKKRKKERKKEGGVEKN